MSRQETMIKPDNRRSKSLSRKINRHNLSKLFGTFLLIDLVMITLFAGMWCYGVETENGTAFHMIRTQRTLSTVHDLKQQNLQSENTRTIIQEYESIEQDQWQLSQPPSLRKTLTEAVYCYRAPTHTTQYAYAGRALLQLSSCLTVLTGLELLILLCNLLWGTHKIRRHLAPLDELAFKAKMLGSTTEFDQAAFNELEQAINAISPTGEGARLHTGNTEMEQLERAINHLLERMRDSYQQQSRFVSDASHELRTPISVLQGYVNMLDRWGKKDETILEESIEAIKSETEHMKTLVEQLLFLARGDSGRTKLSRETFSLNQMMQEVYEESAMIDEKHKYSFQPATEDITITGDLSMLKQTARILIDNAARYTAEDAMITLKTGQKPEPSANAEPCPYFLIQDEGIGIAGKDITHMFERFYRSDPARTKESGGSGLGLSIAKWIIDRHGGYFDVLSRQEIGTRITVFLPQR